MQIRMASMIFYFQLVFGCFVLVLFCFVFLTRTREVVLPKFKLEKSYNLIGYLRSMGTEELFSEKGNYAGISDEKVTINRVFTPLFTSFRLNYIT